MQTKTAVWIGTILGSTIGSYIPALWGANVFSFSSLFLGAAGAILGIYLGFKLTN
jgi:hypothetical protein